MRTIVEDRHIAFSKQTGNGAERASESAVKQHGVFAAEKFRDTPLKFPMQVGHSRKHRRATRTHAMGLERFVRRGNHLRLIRQPEIIIRTEIDDGVRFTIVSDASARISRTEQLGLVKWRCPCLLTHPICEAWRSLKWIVAFTGSEKTTQAKFEGILVHRRSQ